MGPVPLQQHILQILTALSIMPQIVLRQNMWWNTPAEYSAGGKCDRWGVVDITVVIAFHSVKYCLNNSFLCSVLHVPSVFEPLYVTTLPEPKLAGPDWLTKWPAPQKSIMPLSGQNILQPTYGMTSLVVAASA